MLNGTAYFILLPQKKNACQLVTVMILHTKISLYQPLTYHQAAIVALETGKLKEQLCVKWYKFYKIQIWVLNDNA